MKPRQPPRTSVRGRCQFQQVRRKPGRCERTLRSGPPLTHQAEVFSYERRSSMAVEALRCKECGASYPLEARYVCEQCFGPLEVAYDYSRPRRRRGASGKIQAGPQRHLALRRLPAASTSGPRDRARARADAAGPRRPARRAPRPGRGLGQERRRQPDPLVQGPRRRGRAREGAASSASRRSPAPRPATSPTPSPPTPPPPGSTPTSSSPPTSRSRSSSPPASTARNLVGVRGNYDDVNRLCTELSPSAPWAFVNVNLRPYYAEGSKTLAYEIVEQLGWELPDRVVCPIASGSLFTKIGRGLRGVARARAGRGRAAGLQRRPGRRAARPVATAFADGLGRLQARSSRTRSPRAWRSATRPTAPTRSSWRARTGGAIDAVTDDEIRDGIRLLAETTGIFTETAGGVTTACWRSSPSAARSAPTSGSSLYITGEGLKTLDAVRERVRDARDRADARVVRGRAASRSPSAADKVRGRWQSR